MPLLTGSIEFFNLEVHGRCNINTKLLFKVIKSESKLILLLCNGSQILLPLVQFELLYNRYLCKILRFRVPLTTADLTRVMVRVRVRVRHRVRVRYKVRVRVSLRHIRRSQPMHTFSCL